MKKALRIFGYVVAVIILLIAVLFGYYYFSKTIPINSAKEKVGPPADTLTVAGEYFRDLNKNGSLDPYEDYRQPVDRRVDDLLARMTTEEKAGMMFHNFLAIGPEGKLAGALNPMNVLPIHVALFEKKMNFFNLFNTPDVAATARWHNRIQRLAVRARLGIPVTISSDPRHTVMEDGAAIGFYTEGFSHWTEPIGFGAIRDPDLVQRFGQIAAQEYRAVGIHTALHPMVDLATDPRWGRISGTFGEDAELTAELGAAYIRGFQGDSLSSSSVATMAKHFPGGGPQEDGWDPHFQSGKNQVYPGNNFDYHLMPFRAAIEAGTAQMMPYYGVPVGQTQDEVAFGFNVEMLSDLLTDSLGYQGIICTDWGLINNLELFGIELMGAKDYGVEHLTPVEKVRKSLDAGADQFGGESTPEHVVQLVNEGTIPESRLNRSVRKLLKLKFQLGLFDDPYVDVEAASRLTSTPEADSLGYLSQLRSQVLLTNKKIRGERILPLERSAKIYIQNLDSTVAARYGEITGSVEEADVAILNLQPPFEPGRGIILGMEIFHQGRLYYTEEELQPVMEIMRKKPTVVTMYMERPAVIPQIADSAAAILANFGATDRAIFDILFGEFNPEGKLPFEIPSSWEAVLNQREDLPFDSENPLFPFGHGLSY